MNLCTHLFFRDCPEEKDENDENRRPDFRRGSQRQDRPDPRQRSYNGRGGGQKCYKCNHHGHFSKVRG